MDTVPVVQVAPNLHFVVVTHNNILKRKKTDDDTMYGNTSLTVTHKACVTHYQILIQ